MLGIFGPGEVDLSRRGSMFNIDDIVKTTFLLSEYTMRCSIERIDIINRENRITWVDNWNHSYTTHDQTEVYSNP